LGAELRGLSRMMTDFIDDPGFVRELFDFVLEMEVRFARAQVEAGVDIIGIGDAAASLVGPQIYGEFVFPCEKKLVDAVHGLGSRVRLHICGNTTAILPWLGRLECEIIDLDWMVSFERARAAMGETQVLAGNVDPVAVMRRGTPELVTAAIEECQRQAGRRYIVAAGCEVPRGTPEANLLALRDYARSHSPLP
jgi:MtaA/CmuA family methyltransferase